MLEGELLLGIFIGFLLPPPRFWRLPAKAGQTKARCYDVG